MILKHLLLSITILALFLTIFGAIGYSQVYSGEIDLVFAPQVVKEVNLTYKETPGHTEFLGALELKNGRVDEFILVGYKDLDNNQTELVRNFDLRLASIHSHPSGLCAPSASDRLVLKGKICLICGINHIRCFENRQTEE